MINELRAHRLAEIRKSHHVTQRALTATMDVSQAQVSTIERGQLPIARRAPHAGGVVVTEPSPPGRVCGADDFGLVVLVRSRGSRSRPSSRTDVSSSHGSVDGSSWCC